MKDAYYFPHDTNAIQDPKLMKLLGICGPAGIGMYWIIIEILHQQKDGILTKEEYESYVNFYMKWNPQQSDELIASVKQNLIKCSTLVENDNFVFSERVLANKKLRKELSNERSVAGKAGAYKRWNTKDLIANAIAKNSNTIANDSKGKERKGKEIKEDILFADQPSADGALPHVGKKQQTPAQQAYELFLNKYKEQTGAEYVAVWGKHCKLLGPAVRVIKPDEYQECIDNYFDSQIGRDKRYSFDFFIASINSFRTVNV